MSKNHSQKWALHFLASSALPAGSFAWSQGLESAAEARAVTGPEDLLAYLADVVTGGLAVFDLPLLYRAHRAAAGRELTELRLINDLALAGRETYETYQAETEMGRALGRLIDSLGRPGFCRDEELGLLAAYALLASVLADGLEEADLGLAYAVSFLENQLAAASRLIPLGQTGARKIMISLSPVVSEAVTAAETLSDEEIGSKLFGLAILCSGHEYQFSRLFRS
ncbi:MAG: urease accessory protein UreF [Deltaproteobacteria bacterium]|nr:urease accessory protein UreF [Deltaproteobacteria bacterium]